MRIDIIEALKQTTESIRNWASEKLTDKVDKIDGKGLSTNDYTTAEKDKLAEIDTGANKTIVDSTLSSTSTNPVQNKVIDAAISGLNNAKINKEEINTIEFIAIDDIDAICSN